MIFVFPLMELVSEASLPTVVVSVLIFYVKGTAHVILNTRVEIPTTPIHSPKMFILAYVVFILCVCVQLRSRCEELQKKLQDLEPADLAKLGQSIIQVSNKYNVWSSVFE